LWTITLLIVFAVTGTLAVDRWVTASTASRIFDDVAAVPARRVGLLLGTSKWVAGGRINLYYQYRIDAAVALYRAGKVQFFLLSGDNRRHNYNEPETMRADLIAAGIPAEKIFLDYAGLRTLDSIVRCKEVFGEREIVVISQPFHNGRALFLAQRKGMDAVAFNARDVQGPWGLKVQVREKAARVKMLLDLLVGKRPRHGGPRITIG